MTYSVANEEQEIDAVLSAAAHSRWVELRKQRKPSAAERLGWIRAWLIGEQLRSSDEDVLRVDRLALALTREEVDEWVAARNLFDAFDRLQEELDEIASTDFRKIAGDPP